MYGAVMARAHHFGKQPSTSCALHKLACPYTDQFFLICFSDLIITLILPFFLHQLAAPVNLLWKVLQLPFMKIESNTNQIWMYSSTTVLNNQ